MYFRPLNMTDCLMKAKASIELPSFMGLQRAEKSICNNKNKNIEAKSLPQASTEVKMNRVHHFARQKDPMIKMSYRDRDISALIAGSLMVLACLFAAYKAKQDTTNEQKTPDYPAVLQAPFARDL